jgi:hypothetical protein
MGAAPDMSSQYMNTMVFAVVAGIISLMLMLLIMRASDTVRQYSAFIITLEVGLVLIILLAITRIIVYERAKLKSSQIGQNNLIHVTTCPDYWTRTGDDECVNTFIASPNYSYRITGVETVGAPGAPAPNPRRVLKLSDYDGKSIVQACNLVKTGSSAAGIAAIVAPWTDVKTVCDSYRL